MSDNFVDSGRSLTDEELIGHINSGEYEYLKELVNCYMPLILKIVKKYEHCGCDVEDLVQEGIFAIFSAVRSFDGTRASFPTFAELCVNRAVATQVRTLTVAKRIPDKLITPIDEVDISDFNSPEKLFIEKESFLSLQDSIRVTLSGLENKVLSAFLEGNSYADIAGSLGISVKSVDNSLKRIREKLKNI